MSDNIHFVHNTLSKKFVAIFYTYCEKTSRVSWSDNFGYRWRVSVTGSRESLWLTLTCVAVDEIVDGVMERVPVHPTTCSRDGDSLKVRVTIFDLGQVCDKIISQGADPSVFFSRLLGPPAI